MKEREFKMKEVVYKKVLAWNPDCMTKHPEWVALLDDKQIASGDTKTEVMQEVRRYRKKAKR